MVTCLEFTAAWKSNYTNCHTCRYWDRDNFICMNAAEIARRKKAKETDSTDRMMRRNKAVYIPPE